MGRLDALTKRLAAVIGRSINTVRKNFINDAKTRSLIEATPGAGNDNPYLPPDWRGAVDAMTADQIYRSVYDVLLEEYRNGYIDPQEDIATLSTGFDVPNQRAEAAVHKAAYDFATDWLGNEKTALRNVIGDGVAAGSTPEQIGAGIRALFDSGVSFYDDNGQPIRTIPLTDYSNLVAQTELSRAYNQGAMDLYADAGLENVMWSAADIPTTCPECEATDGQVVALGEIFEPVGVDSPPAHPMCLCAIVADPVSIQQLQDLKANAEG